VPPDPFDARRQNAGGNFPLGTDQRGRTVAQHRERGCFSAVFQRGVCLPWRVQSQFAVLRASLLTSRPVWEQQGG
jgi:hypothetical protein